MQFRDSNLVQYPATLPLQIHMVILTFYCRFMSLGKYNALLGLQLNSYSLPSGYAVISSNLSMTTQTSSGGSIDIGVWELSSNDWNEQEVTWLESSSGNPWTLPGIGRSR